MNCAVPALAAHMCAHLARQSAGQLDVFAGVAPWSSQHACSGEVVFQPMVTHGPRSPLYASSRS